MVWARARAGRYHGKAQNTTAHELPLSFRPVHAVGTGLCYVPDSGKDVYVTLPWKPTVGLGQSRTPHQSLSASERSSIAHTASHTSWLWP